MKLIASLRQTSQNSAAIFYKLFNQYQYLIKQKANQSTGLLLLLLLPVNGATDVASRSLAAKKLDAYWNLFIRFFSAATSYAHFKRQKSY